MRPQVNVKSWNALQGGYGAGEAENIRNVIYVMLKIAFPKSSLSEVT